MTTYGTVYKDILIIKNYNLIIKYLLYEIFPDFSYLTNILSCHSYIRDNL
jgi:hypothetical protein